MHGARPWDNNWNEHLSCFPQLGVLYLKTHAIPFDWSRDAPDEYPLWAQYWEQPQNQQYLERTCEAFASLWMSTQPRLCRIVFDYGGKYHFGMDSRYMEFGRMPGAHVDEITGATTTVACVQNTFRDSEIPAIVDYHPDPFDPRGSVFRRPPSGPSYFNEGFAIAGVQVYLR